VLLVLTHDGLDGQFQHIMQALAFYRRPVVLEAVDCYLLLPQPTCRLPATTLPGGDRQRPGVRPAGRHSVHAVWCWQTPQTRYEFARRTARCSHGGQASDAQSVRIAASDPLRYSATASWRALATPGSHRRRR
jgi:hypothetical protein